jgi:hypothetical protein
LFAEDASSFEVADAAGFGEETPELVCALSSAFARSTTLFDSVGLLFSCVSSFDWGCLSAVVKSTSSAQLLGDAVSNSDRRPVAGVAAPDVTLLEGACDVDVETRPFAACA